MGIWKLQWQREALEECCLFICKDFLSLLQSWQFLQQVNAIVRGVMHRQNVRHAMHRKGLHSQPHGDRRARQDCCNTHSNFRCNRTLFVENSGNNLSFTGCRWVLA